MIGSLAPAVKPRQRNRASRVRKENRRDGSAQTANSNAAPQSFAKNNFLSARNKLLSNLHTNEQARENRRNDETAKEGRRRSRVRCRNGTY
jgi:hypothetical protein